MYVQRYPSKGRIGIARRCACEKDAVAYGRVTLVPCAELALVSLLVITAFRRTRPCSFGCALRLNPQAFHCGGVACPLVAASFGSAIAICEFLTGGIPIGLASERLTEQQNPPSSGLRLLTHAQASRCGAWPSRSIDCAARAYKAGQKLAPRAANVSVSVTTRKIGADSCRLSGRQVPADQRGQRLPAVPAGTFPTGSRRPLCPASPCELCGPMAPGGPKDRLRRAHRPSPVDRPGPCRPSRPCGPAGATSP